MGCVTIVAISDTHGMHRDVSIPDGDILVHAGDITAYGTLEEVEEFNAFLGELPHKQRLIIAGNHDWCLERKNQDAMLLMTNCVYLQDSAVTIRGLKFYGSPWQPKFMDWAFNLPRGSDLQQRWKLIPSDTDVLITHGPPFSIGDATHGEHVGCQDLLGEMERILPTYHIYGHIHEGYGQYSRGTEFINASVCNEFYEPVNKPIVIEIGKEG